MIKHQTSNSNLGIHRRIVRSIAGIVAAILLMGAAAIPAGAATSTSGPGLPTGSGGQAQPALGSATPAPTFRASAAKEPQERIPAPKAADTAVESGRSSNLLQVKFVEGTDVLLRDGAFVTAAGNPIPALDSVITRFPGSLAERLFSDSEQALRTDQQQVEASSGREQANLNNYYRIKVAPGQDVAALADALNGLGIVETAYLEALPTPNPVTPSFAGSQGYHAAGAGIDATYAHTLAGGRGENVRIIDVEYGWNRTHEDLSRLRAAGSDIRQGVPSNPFDDNHGTAVIGEMAGDPNGIGVSGLAPGAFIATVNQRTTAGDGRANAIYLAAQNASPGDVILLEMQTTGLANTCGADQVGCVPVEWEPAIYDAIVSATSAGIIVVEAGGNGHVDLNSSVYGTSFPSGRADSGAIIVGAGGAGGTCHAARSRLDFSNSGNRVDVQGWGECIVTTGYADLQGGDHNAWYTRGFGGTSGASPIVASAAAILSSIAEARGTRLTPRDVRTILKSTGQAQTAGLAGKIGPLPDLKAAIAAIPTGGSTTKPAVNVTSAAIAPGASANPAGTAPVKFQWSATDPGGIAQYSVYMKTGTADWAPLAETTTNTSATVRLAIGTKYQLAVAAQSSGGSWSDWAYGAAFVAGAWEENSKYVTYSDGWARKAYAPASGGFVGVTATPGAVATFSFTGRSVGWVASKGTNRGKAQIYIDGKLRTTVDLYSATAVAGSVVKSFYWATPGRHTIQVVAVGTAGRPKVDVDSFMRLT